MNSDDKRITVEYDLKVVECPCGSKKKPEKCCGPVKPRTYSAEMDSINFHTSDGFAIGNDFQIKRIVDNKLEPLIGEVQFAQKYSRSKTDKVIVQGTSNSDYVMSPESILMGYDSIYFVDTNTKHLGDNKISMTGVVYAFIENIEENEYKINWLPLTVLEFWDTEIDPEIMGWYSVISGVMEIPENKHKNILLVVDSKLDELNLFSIRKLPLFRDYYIPSNINLVFASADVASNIANKLIKISDRLASVKLNEVLSNPRKESLKETDYPCRWFRQWTN